jgi:hypothetical protein
MSYYKFSIIFENSIGPNGYISEKIWDAFASGTIPVYLGPQNIQKLVPENCFIDYRKFKSNESMYSYIKNMSSQEISKYQENIQLFLEMEAKGGKFSDIYFVEKFISQIKTLN